jgi:hypothetical protein
VSAVSHHLFTLLPSPTFPSASDGGTTEALNCLRVLGRVLVVIYESEDREWADEVLWSRQKRPADEPRSPRDVVETEAETQFTIADSDDEGDAEAAEDADSGDIGDEGARAFKASVGKPAKASPEPVTNGDGTLRDPLANPGPQPEAPAAEADADTLPSLAERLFSCTVDLLFCAGFTVPDSVRGEDLVGDKINVG